MLDLQIDDHVIRARLDSMPGKMQQSLTRAITILAEKLRNHIIRDKLMGQVLNRRSGALGRSIQQRVESSATAVTGIVYSSGDVVYGRIHEYGATVHRRMTQAWGRPVKNPREIVAHYPERSFMRSSLRDMREEIVQKMQQAVIQGTK